MMVTDPHILHGISLVAAPRELKYFGQSYPLGKFNFTIRSWHSVIVDLNEKTVTATGALCYCGDQLVMTCNPRGWDIPGGHLEKGETIIEALSRELKEEINSNLIDYAPLFVLESDRDPIPTYIPIFRANVTLIKSNQPYQKEGEISGVKVVDQNTFVEIYHCDSIFRSALFEAVAEQEKLEVTYPRSSL